MFGHPFGTRNCVELSAALRVPIRLLMPANLETYNSRYLLPQRVTNGRTLPSSKIEFRAKMDSTKSVGIFMLFRLMGLSFEENDRLAWILEKNCTTVIAISKRKNFTILRNGNEFKPHIYNAPSSQNSWLYKAVIEGETDRQTDRRNLRSQIRFLLSSFIKINMLQ